ncbi:hypothetical protein EV659_105120 [Rhodothalassium salexigens DSM 2132]|uniref:Asparagine synthase (Glutamine-hydrolysing) n=1 Tax=Rhodothalassium salexigens DSM 2132 TaxID=1188247 RepID=A0A4R2PGK6_RHOSA|nr:hypothetical protein [Rhodothalassium salexigens]MBB4211576.1 asparagine synthase (glutamine-hydrolyzing) [Rhodothalassium salexigens DSM 2132]MBK1638404.1 hypothetical protein [Rhodothalassium salexigens DSM 2132]TCP34492.1 hypothetical protein EV659_105120 [Rhodothalassium salexigens DSM 2132]
MSFYVLIRDDAPGQADLPAFLRLVEAHGFRPRRRPAIGPWHLILVDNPDHSVIAEAATPQADLVAVGPLLSGETGGAAALRRLAAHIVPGAPDWRDTAGHFSLLHIAGDRVLVRTDGLGAHKVYHDPGRRVFTNSFLAALALTDDRRLDPFGVYTYAWAGAFHGNRTLARGVTSLPARTDLIVHGAEVTVTDPVPWPAIERRAPVRLDEAARQALAPLRHVIAGIARSADGRVRLSFSGGYDSRLLLGLLLEQGVRPSLFVYGPDGDIDVEIAKRVAAAEDLPLDRIDKARTAPPPPERFAAQLDRDMVLFDGWKTPGLFDSGADAQDRRSRHVDAMVPLNGGLGEIYRNFFNLRDRRYRAEDVVDAFYAQFDPAHAGAHFAARHYRQQMAEQMRAQLPGRGERLGALDAQLLYPLFRGRFWTAREAEINQRFGPMAFPFLEHSAIAAAQSLPLSQKNFGRLQAAMIAEVCPRIADLPSSYGFAFSQPPSLRYRFDAVRSIARPVALRGYLAQLRRPAGGPMPTELTRPYLSAVMDATWPVMGDYFAVDRVEDEDTFNRIATMEYLAQRFGLS